MRFAIEKIFLWWLFYSVVGWVWETGLNLVLRKKWVDRGILNGPLCPIYGFGAASVIVLLHDVDNPIALFLSSGMLACTLEYFSSWAIEKLFHIRLWDYTGKPFNINGRIYLNGFLAFGIGAAVVKEYVQPWVSDVLDSWQPLTLDILTIIFTLILVTDISLTLSGLLSFDNRITQWMVDEFKKTEGVDLSGDKMAMQRLKEAAEKAKKELSSATTTNINLPFITATAEGPKHFDMNLTRAKFDELTHDLVEMTAEPVRRALSDAGITASELGQVLLVGGSSRIPAVQDKVRQLTGKEPSKNLNPDECVALGASIQGGKLAGDAGAGDILLLDVTPLSLSIETMGGIATRLIERNTTIPTRKSQIFSTAADNQTAVDINVVQGERQFAKDNKSLGQFRLDGIPPARRGVPQIEVTFDIDANGIVNVSAKDLGTGKEQHITITAGSNMSDSDIDKAVKEAAEFEAQDKKRKEAIDTRNNADSMVFQVENALKEAGDKIDANDKAAVEADLNALKDLLSQTANAEEMTDSQVADIKAAQEKMMESAQKLFAKMYEQTQQAGGQAGPDMNMGGGAAGSTDAGNNDDVVDADYKEV